MSEQQITKGDIVRVGNGAATWKVFQISAAGDAWLLRAVRANGRYEARNVTARGVQSTRTVHVSRLCKIA